MLGTVLMHEQVSGRTGRLRSVETRSQSQQRNGLNMLDELAVLADWQPSCMLGACYHLQVCVTDDCFVRLIRREEGWYFITDSYLSLV